MNPTFSTAIDTGYLVCRPTKHRKSDCKGNASLCFKSLFIFGAEQANTFPTFVLVAVDTEVDKATQQEQEENAAGDSSCNASNGRATQPFTCHHQDKQSAMVSQLWHQHMLEHNLTIWHAWTNSVDLRWLSFSHTSFGDHPKPVRQVGIEDVDVCAPAGARFLLDGAKSVWAASSLGAVVISRGGQEVWSFQLDVEPFAKAQAVVFCLILASRLIDHQTTLW